MLGYIYILASPAMPGIVKIGRTRRPPAERAEELDTTAVPIPFAVVAAFDVADMVAAERRVHEALAHRRVRESREFFYLSPADAVPRVEQALGITPMHVTRWWRRIRLGVEALGWLTIAGFALLAVWEWPA